MRDGLRSRGCEPSTVQQQLGARRIVEDAKSGLPLRRGLLRSADLCAVLVEVLEGAGQVGRKAGLSAASCR